MGGVFINGRQAIYKNCGATLETIDPCLLKNGSVQSFKNIATAADAIKTATRVFINGEPVCHKNSQFSTTKGSEAGEIGVSSGTLLAECNFLSASSDVLIEGFGALRHGDQATANHHNTAVATLNFPGTFSPVNKQIPEIPNITVDGDSRWVEFFVLGMSRKEQELINFHITDTKGFVLQNRQLRSANIDLFCDKKQPGNVVHFRYLPVAEEYHCYLVQTNHKESCMPQHFPFLPELSKTWCQSYPIPFFSLKGMSEPMNKSPSSYDPPLCAQVTPIVPVTMDANEKLVPIRSGWIYIFKGGYLWREIAVTSQNISHCTHSHFRDVNLLVHQGKDNRQAFVNAQDKYIIVPIKEMDQDVTLEWAFSEVQWSWAYIQKLGGMDKQDPRYCEELQKETLNISIDEELKTLRLQKINLSNYTAQQGKSVNQRIESGCMPIEQLIKYYRNKQDFEYMGDYIESTKIPMVILLDPIGVARELSDKYQILVRQFIQLIDEIKGYSHYLEGQAINTEQMDSIKKEMITQQGRYITSKFLYESFFSENQAGSKLSEMKELKNCLSEKMLKETLQFEKRRKIRRDVLESKIKLIQWLEKEGKYSFSTAMLDCCALHKDKVYIRYKILNEILECAEHIPYLMDQELPSDLADVQEIIANNVMDNFSQKLKNSHPIKEHHQLHAFLFPEETKDDSRDINSFKISNISDLGTPGLDMNHIYDLTGDALEQYNVEIGKLMIVLRGLSDYFPEEDSNTENRKVPNNKLKHLKAPLTKEQQRLNRVALEKEKESMFRSKEYLLEFHESDESCGYLTNKVYDEKVLLVNKIEDNILEINRSLFFLDYNESHEINLIEEQPSHDYQNENHIKKPSQDSQVVNVINTVKSKSSDAASAEADRIEGKETNKIYKRLSNKTKDASLPLGRLAMANKYSEMTRFYMPSHEIIHNIALSDIFVVTSEYGIDRIERDILIANNISKGHIYSSNLNEHVSWDFFNKLDGKKLEKIIRLQNMSPQMPDNLFYQHYQSIKNSLIMENRNHLYVICKNIYPHNSLQEKIAVHIDKQLKIDKIFDYALKYLDLRKKGLGRDELLKNLSFLERKLAESGINWVDVRESQIIYSSGEKYALSFLKDKNRVLGKNSNLNLQEKARIIYEKHKVNFKESLNQAKKILPEKKDKLGFIKFQGLLCIIGFMSMENLKNMFEQYNIFSKSEKFNQEALYSIVSNGIDAAAGFTQISYLVSKSIYGYNDKVAARIQGQIDKILVKQANANPSLAKVSQKIFRNKEISSLLARKKLCEKGIWRTAKFLRYSQWASTAVAFNLVLQNLYDVKNAIASGDNTKLALRSIQTSVHAYLVYSARSVLKESIQRIFLKLSIRNIGVQLGSIAMCLTAWEVFALNLLVEGGIKLADYLKDKETKAKFASSLWGDAFLLSDSYLQKLYKNYPFRMYLDHLEVLSRPHIQITNNLDNYQPQKTVEIILPYFDNESVLECELWHVELENYQHYQRINLSHATTKRMTKQLGYLEAGQETIAWDRSARLLAKVDAQRAEMGAKLTLCFELPPGGHRLIFRLKLYPFGEGHVLGEAPSIPLSIPASPVGDSNNEKEWLSKPGIYQYTANLFSSNKEPERKVRLFGPSKNLKNELCQETTVLS